MVGYLGPILFVIFINDLPEVVANIANIFADDTKLFRKITSEENRHKIQTDLDMLVRWSEHLHLGSRNPKYDYHMKGVT